MTITNVSAPGETPKAGETVRIRYSDIMTPLPKLGAIYNPGFGGTVYIEGTLTCNIEGFEPVITKSEGVQYDISQNAVIEVTVNEEGTYTLGNTRIHSGSFGSASTTHLTMSRQSRPRHI